VPWLTIVIPTIQEVEMGQITVQGWTVFHKTPSKPISWVL
jgi:hypothetical protein